MSINLSCFPFCWEENVDQIQYDNNMVVRSNILLKLNREQTFQIFPVRIVSPTFTTSIHFQIYNVLTQKLRIDGQQCGITL